MSMPSPIRWRYPELWLLLLTAIVALPLFPLIARIATPLASVLALAVFILPGAACVCLLGDEGNVFERLALAFVASLAVAGVPAQAAILLHANLVVYLWVFGALTALLTVAAVVKCVRTPAAAQETADTEHTAVWLIVAVGAVAVGLVFLALNSPTDGDQWDNVGWTQSILHDPQIFTLEPRFNIAPVSPRFVFSAWLVQQAMMARLSGVDPVDLFFPEQFPLLLLSLAAVYRLARRVTGRKNPAALMTVAWGLYMLVWNDGTVAGYEVIVRSSLDKVIAGFIIVPVALSIALSYCGSPHRRTLLWLLVSAIAAALTHPIAGALLGLSLGGLALLKLVLDRSWQTFRRVVLVGAVLFISLTPSLYLVVWELANPTASIVATSLTDTRDPSLFTEIMGAFNKERIYLLDNGSYVMHPRLVLQLVHIPAFLGLAILLRRLRYSLGAQFLFGILTFNTLLVVLPPTATLLGTMVTPSLFFRLHWPISLAAVMTVGWLAWGALQKIPAPRREAIGVAALMIAGAVALPRIHWNLTWMSELKSNEKGNYCAFADPLLRPFQRILSSRSVVLGDSEDTDFCLIGYASQAKVVAFRGTNGVRLFIALQREQEGWDRVFDAAYYRNAEFVDERLLGILKRWNVRYVIVQSDSPLATQFKYLPGNFRPVTTAFHRQAFQVVSYDITSPVISANTLLLQDRWSDAIRSYLGLVDAGDSQTRFLAGLGLGRAYLQSGDTPSAIRAWEQAVAVSAEPLPLAWLAEAHAIDKDPSLALKAYEQAVALAPDSETWRVRLGDLYLALDKTQQAEKAYQSAAAIASPRGTSYYNFQLGQYWMNGGATDRARAAFRQANQVLEIGSTYAQIGQTYMLEQSWAEAEAAFREIGQLDYWDAEGNINLGHLYSAQNKYLQAESEYRQGLALHPLKGDAYAGLANTWMAQRGTPFAREQLRSLPGYRLGFGPALTTMAGVLSRQGQASAALRDGQRAIRWYRLGVQSYIAVARQYSEMGQQEEAAQFFRMAGQLDGARDTFYLGLSQIASDQGDNATSQGYAVRAIMASPHSPAGYLILADQLEREASPGALEKHRQAIDNSVDKADAWLAMGQYLLRQGRPDDATASYQNSDKLLPGTTAGLRGIGRVQQNAGQLLAAQATFEQAVRQRPGDAANRQALASVLFQLGRSDEAVAQLEKAVALEPGSASLSASLADAYLRLGRMAEAESTYVSLVEAAPLSIEGYVGLGRVVDREGDSGRAAQVYRQAIANVAPSIAGPAVLALANLERRQGRNDAALADFETAIRSQPTLDLAYVGLAQFYAQRGEFALADKVLRRGLALTPGSPTLNVALARIQLSQGNVNDAERTLAGVWANSPGAVQSAIGLSMLHAAQGNPEQGLADITEALGLWPASSDLAIQKADLEIYAGRPLAGVSTTARLVTLWPASVDVWLARGRAYAAAAQFDSALAAFQKATQLEPGNPQAWLALGLYQVDRGNMAEAKRALQQGMTADQSQVDAHIAYAGILEREGKQRDAIHEYETAAELDATRSSALLALARIHQQMEQTAEAQKDVQRAILASPVEPAVYRAQSQLDLVQGQLGPAERALQKAAAVAPGACHAFENLGDFYAQRGDYTQSESNYQMALSLPGCAASTRVALGNSYLVRAQLDPAIEQYKQASAASPGDPFPYVVLATTYTDQLRWIEANATFSAASAKVPTSDLLYLSKGRSLLLQAKPKESLDALKHAVELRPASAFDLIELGRAYEVMGQLENAQASYRQAAALEQNLPDPQMALGDLFARLGAFDQAESAFRQAVQLAPADHRTYDSLALYLRTRNQPDQSLALLKQASRVDQSQVESLLYLGGIYQQRGQTADSEAAYRQALQVGTAETTFASPLDFQKASPAPSTAQVYVGLGDLWLSQGKTSAEQSYKKAIQVAPANPIAYLHLGMLYQSRGRANDATAQYQLAVRANPRSTQAYVAASRLAWSQQDRDAAETSLLKAVAVSPIDAKTYMSAARLYQAEGLPDKAWAQYQTGSKSALAASQISNAIGDHHLAQGNWQAAEEAYAESLRLAPTDVDARIGLGQVYAMQAQWDKAVAELKAAGQMMPSSFQSYIALGDLYRVKADWQNAERVYKQAIQVAPTDPLGYVSLGETYLAEGLQQEALAQFQSAVKAAPASPLGYLAQGDLYSLQADWSSAERSYRQAFKVAPTNALGYIGLGRVYQARGMAPEALAQFMQAVKAAPASGEAYAALGGWYKQQMDWTKATEAYKQAIQAAPTDQRGYVGLGQTYLAQGMFSEAIAAFQSGVQSAPLSVEARLALADAYMLRADWNAARGVYENALSVIPAASPAYIALGRWYELHGDPAAEEQYRQALAIAPAGDRQRGTIAPPNPAANIALGRLYQTLGRPEDALAQFKQAAATVPGSPAALLALGDWYQSQADDQRAEQTYEQATQLNPSDAEGYVRQSGVYQARGEFEKAVTILESGRALDPGNANLLVALGTVHLQRGRVISATVAFKDALALQPANTDASSLLAVAYSQQFLYTQAETVLRAAVDSMPGLSAPYVSLGNYNLSRLEWDAALSAYRQALTQSPADALAHEGIVKAYLLSGREKQALQEAEGWVKDAPAGASEPLLTLAASQRAVGSVSEALDLYRRVQSIWPGKTEAALGLAQTMQAQGDVTQALAVLDSAVRIAPNSSMLYQTHGQVLETMGKLDAAMDDYRRAAALEGTNADPLIAQAHLRAAQANRWEAIELYKKGINAQPTNAETYVKLVALYLDDDEYEDALKIARQGVENVRSGQIWPKINPFGRVLTPYGDPPLPPELVALFALADAYYPVDFGSALRTLESALPKYPKFQAAILSRIGDLYGKARDADKALEYYRQALAADPVYIDAYLGRGDVYSFLLGNFEKALEAYERAAEINGRIPTVYARMFRAYAHQRYGSNKPVIDETCLISKSRCSYELGAIKLRTGLSGELEAKYKANAAANPNSIEANTRLAVFYEAFDLAGPAIDTWKRVLKLDPANAEAYLHLSALYARRADGRKPGSLAAGQAIAFGLEVQQAHNLLVKLNSNRINFPEDSWHVKGMVQIMGTATGTHAGFASDFQYYKIDLASGALPNTWSNLGSWKQEVVRGVLWTWDTTAWDNGVYTLRFTVVDRSANEEPWQDIAIQIANP